MFNIFSKLKQKDKVLVYKWGSPTKIFSASANKGETRDLDLEALIGILLENNYEVDFLGELAYKHNCKNCKFKDMQNFRFIDKTDNLSLKQLTPKLYKLCIIFLGKDNTQFNNFFVSFALKNNLKIIGVTTDHRYLTINAPLPLNHVYTSLLETKHIFDKLYQRTIQIHSSKIGYEFALYNIQKHYKPLNKEELIKIPNTDILIGANQIEPCLEDSRWNQIKKVCNINRDKYITLLGKWDRDFLINNKLEIPTNLHILNLQVDYNLYLNYLTNFEKVVILHDDNPAKFDKDINYKNNFIPIRTMEAIILDVSYCFNNSTMSYRSIKSLIESSPSFIQAVKHHIKKGVNLCM